jgi:hypothetical protein
MILRNFAERCEANSPIPTLIVLITRVEMVLTNQMCLVHSNKDLLSIIQGG